jgi:hypothetical protein
MLFRMPRRVAVAALALAALGARAPRAEPIEATYALSQTGITVMDVQLSIDLSNDRYRVASLSRSRGIGRLFLPREQRAEVVGGLAGRDVQPYRYLSEGEWRGSPRRTVLEYLGGAPRLVVLEPREEPDRLPVPPEQRDGTIDTLSALVRLARNTGATGRCDLSGAVFDGRRRLEWNSRTLGIGAPPIPGLTGEALRCRLESRLVAGFRRGDDPAQAGRPREADAWIAVLRSDAPPMPLRVEFPATILGAMRLDLVRLGPSGP